MTKDTRCGTCSACYPNTGPCTSSQHADPFNNGQPLDPLDNLHPSTNISSGESDERAAFEAEYLRIRPASLSAKTMFERVDDTDDRYAMLRVQGAWEGWQARAALATQPAAPAEVVASNLALHPSTADLVKRFAQALAEKLAAAELKYGYSDGWLSPDWMDECRSKLLEHVAKGDPRDVAAYCAFLWHHNTSTATPPSQAPAAPLWGAPVAFALRGHIKTLRLSGRNDGLVEDMERAAEALLATPPAAPAATEAPSDAVLDAVDSLIGQIKHVADGTQNGVWRDLLARCETVTAAIAGTAVSRTLATPAPAVGASEREEGFEKYWVARADFDKMSGDLTRAKNLLVRLWDKHPAARAQIEASTGSWFVWGQDRDAPAAVGASVQPVLASLSDEQPMSLIDAIHALDIHNRSAKQMAVRISQNPGLLIEALRGLS